MDQSSRWVVKHLMQKSMEISSFDMKFVKRVKNSLTLNVLFAKNVYQNGLLFEYLVMDYKRFVNA